MDATSSPETFWTDNNPVKPPAPPPRPSTICRVCWEGPFTAYLGVLGPPTATVSDLTPVPLGRYSYSTSRTELESRASMGCLWCRFVSALCQHGLDSTSGEKDELQIKLSEGLSVITIRTPAGAQGLSVTLNDDAHVACQGYLHTAADDPASGHIVARSPLRSVGSPHALLLAKQGIDECVRGHKRCIAMLASADPPLPTRVVDCNDPSHPRLAPTDSGCGKYLALSYVWGEPQPHRTLLGNVANYTNGIDIRCLPQTIRDAIHVTHALGFRFLWVDSLCIIQDSDADKRRELARMHRIYRDAYLTVIAASACRVSEGFLQDRPAVTRTHPKAFPYALTLPFICPPRTPAPSGTGLDGAAIQPVGEVHFAPTFSFLDMQFVEQYSHASEPISTRAWCLQEYFMSPRSLIFTSETLQLRCQTATRNVGNSFYDPDGERRLPDALFLPNQPPPERNSRLWEEAHHTWLRIVEDYTRRGVSVSSDKLVACGAIAAEFQRVLRSEYVAGLWREMLPCDLLWRRTDGADLVRPAVRRAPSWSWAAVDGPVTMPRGWPRPLPQYIAVVTVVGCEVALEDAAASFGRVVGGSLVLRTALLPCELLTPDTELEHGNRRVMLSPIRIQPACIPPELEGGGSNMDELETDAQAPRPSGWAAVDIDFDVDVREAWVVPLERSEMAVEGLIVIPVDSGTGSEPKSKPGAYERIGVFHIKTFYDNGLYGALKDRALPLSIIRLV